MSNRFEYLLPHPSEPPPIKKIGSAEITIPDNARQAWNYLNLGLDYVDFGEGKEGVHWNLDVPQGAMVAHVDDNDNLLIIRNTRYPLIKMNGDEVVDNGISFELPGGGVDPVDIEQLRLVHTEEALRILGRNAMREFQEEVGIKLSPDDLTHLNTVQLGVGVSNLKIDTFHATGGTEAEQSLDDGEATLKVFRVPLRDAYEMTEAELIREAATVGTVKDLVREYDIPVPKKLNLKKHSFARTDQR